MAQKSPIPVFTLFGETGGFPDVVHCERIRDRAPVHGWRIDPHRHAQMAQIFTLDSGSADVQIDAGSDILSPGQFLFVPARIVHGFNFRPGTEGHVLSFPQTVLDSIVPTTDELPRSLSLVHKGTTTARLAGLVELLASEFANVGPLRRQVLVGLAHALLAAMIDTSAGGTARNPSAATGRLQRFDALIAQHMGDGWLPRDYARALSITTGQLSRICRAATGMGATAYLEAQLLTEACRLLAFTRMPVAEVGYRLGFQDPSYFSRRFRQGQGQSPSEYRGRFT